MSSRLFHFRACIVWTICVACAAGGILRAGDRPHGRSIEITEPKGANTNLNTLGPRTDGLRNLEQDLSKPLQSFGWNSSLEGAMAKPIPPPRQTVVPDRRARQREERRRNWVFSSPEELLMPELTPEEAFHLPNSASEDDRSASPFERYYRQMTAAHKSATNHVQKPGFQFRDPSTDWNDTWADSDAASPNNPDSTETNLKKMPNSSFGPPVFTPPSSAFGNVFGTKSDDSTIADNLRTRKAHEERMETFKKIWDTPAVTPAPAAPVADFGRAPSAPNTGGYPFSTTHKSFEPVFGTVSSPMSGAPAPAGFTPATPVVPQRVFPSHQDFTMPRRGF